MSPSARAGFALLPVVLLVAVLAAVAFLITHDGAMSTELLRSAADADEAEYVAEAGLRHALWQLDDSACGGDLTLASTGFGAHSYSASVTAGGATTASSLSVDQDAWIRNDIPTSNNGGNNDQHIRFEGGNVELALTRFDLSSLAAGARINSAVAWFYVKSTGAHPEGPLTVHRVTADWAEGGVTWDSFASGFDPAELASIPPQAAGDVWVSVNLTSQVQAWMNGEPNFGILLASASEGVHAQYVSSEGSSGERPRLDVVVGSGAASPANVQVTGTLANGVTRTRSRPSSAAYQPASTLSLQPDAAQGKDTYLSGSQPSNNYGTDDDSVVAEHPGDTSLALLEFDLAGVLPGAKVRGATLSLYHRSGSGTDVPVTAHRITSSWSEEFATWQNRALSTPWTSAGGDVDPRVFATTNVGPASSTRYEWDLTDLVQGWASGAYPNYGVALRTALDGMLGERFDTSDHSDAARRPRLTVSYACECGSGCMTPQGAGNVLMVIGSSPANPAPEDQVIRDTLESWGYSVSLIQDDDDGDDFDDGVAANDVVYISESVTSGNVGSKLTSASIGVVNAEGQLNDELGISTSRTSPVDDTIDVVDASHYITRVFPTAPLRFKTAPTQLQAVGGTVAPGAQVLAAVGGVGSVVALDNGATLPSGGSAAGRRVLVPVGEADVGWRYLTNDGRLVVQRALQWAGGLTGPIAAGPGLWVSTLNDVSGSGAPGLDAWSDGEALAFAEPDLAFEPGTTGGTFASVFDLDDFAGNADIDAIHHVDTAVTVGGANSIDLLPGDVLLSTADNETLSSTNSLSVNDEDVFVFRPDAAGDYSAGTFIFLIDGSQIHAEADTVGVSLVEKDTAVGDGGLSQGTFIIATTNRRDVIEFTADDVGQGTTAGAMNEFIDGPSLSLGSEIRGMELAEDPVALGGHSIPAGAILLTLNNDDTGGVGDNLVPVDSADVFYLTVAQTGASPVADATLLFEGVDVNLDSSDEHVQALSLKGVTTAAAAAPPQDVLFVVGNLANVTAEEDAHQALIESWGYTVERIDDDDDPATFDAALARNDVAFLTNDVTASRVGNKLSNTAVGVVTSEGNLSDELGMAAAIGWESGSVVRLEDNTHYITSPFALGNLTIFDNSESLAYVTDTLAPDLALLAGTGSGYGVVALAAGADALEGRTSPGRRVQLPWGGNGFDPTVLTADGETILRRALEWGAGEGGGVGPGVPIDPPGGGGGGGPGYVEAHQLWSASSADSWQSVDLGSYGVPADAVVEVAVTNDNANAQRWGGVRAVGSSLDRRFQLHEAESGGVDALVMHVQADAGSRIEHYADATGDVRFTLLGYWTGASYEERFDSFAAGGSGSWREHDLGAYGVGPSQVAEIVMVNTSSSSERLAGLRPSGASMNRRIGIHEAESGGVDTATMMVNADASSIAEVYAASNADIAFYVVGYWTTPPGTYSEVGAVHGQASAASTWQSADLGAFGFPADSIAQILMSNEGDTAEQQMGVRAVGSDVQRVLDLQEAEAGGGDSATLHVNVDGSARIEWYSESGAADRYFYPVGWWVLEASP